MQISMILLTLNRRRRGSIVYSGILDEDKIYYDIKDANAVISTILFWIKDEMKVDWENDLENY